MRKRNRRQENSPIFDTSLKGLFEQQAPALLPLLLPGAIYEETITIEIIRPTMRADQVYKILYRDSEHILHVEFESGPDNEMSARLLAYNAVLYMDYGLPVISLIVYPFRTKIAESPLRITSGQETLITFHFFILPLFTLEAERYVQEHLVCMYPLLPTMQGVNRELIGQAVEEMAELYQGNPAALADQIVWLDILLERTDTIPLGEKRAIKERIHMLDSLWKDNPKVQKIQAESKAEGKAEGELLALQSVLADLTGERFPNLVEQVQKIKNPDDLRKLIKQIAKAPDEATARWLFSTYIVQE